MDVVKEALDSVLAEAVLRLAECSIPVGQVGVVPGTSPAWDACDCEGQMWARVVDVTPVVTKKADGAPSVDFLNVQAALGIIRCQAGLADDGTPPSSAEMDADADRMLKDAAALFDALIAQGAVITRGAPLGTQGNCGGFEWTFTFAKIPCEGC